MNARTLEEHGWPCPTAEEMARVDRAAIERFGLPGRLLMENAGRAVAHGIRSAYPEVRRPLVVCGAGVIGRPFFATLANYG